MKEIPLTQGKVALVDDEDYEALVRHKWYYHNGYAVRNKRKQDGKQAKILMHRVILDTPPEYQTDHINRNGLDNRKENLRVATQSQNQCNTGKRRNNTSGFKGVGWCKSGRKWQAQIEINRRKIHLGYFVDKVEAARAYNTAAIKCHSEFSVFNQT